MRASEQPSSFSLEDRSLQARLAQCTELPSPVGIAARILELGGDPDVTLAQVAEVISLDPALTAKLLRMANSPLYARQRKTENLRQAITLFGLEGTITLALSFSVVNNLDHEASHGLDYDHFWRRSLAVATCAQALGDRLGQQDKEDLFLAGLLQDIGMLALDKAVPDLYRGVPQSDHRGVQAHERATIDSDHAEIGAWLLQRWNLPERLRYIVSVSHDPLSNDGAPALVEQAKIVSLASDMADLWCDAGRGEDLDKVMQRAERLLGMEGDSFVNALETAIGTLHELTHLFDIESGKHVQEAVILAQAKELMLLRNINAMQKSLLLEKTAKVLESRTRKLEEENRRDILSGLYNRGHLEQVLKEEIRAANRHGWVFTVMFLDLDGFKRINDNHGHLAGDEIIKNAAKILTASTRGSDVIARYGGEEFVVVLPGTGEEGARRTCERLLQAFRRHRHEIDDGTELVVTASIGVAVHGEGRSFDRLEDIVRAADQALYAAKRQGRDRYVFYTEL